MRLNFNISTFYILAWILYYLQELLPSDFGPIARVLLLLNFVISIYYAFVANLKYKLPVYFKGLNFMLVMFTLYGILLMLDPRPLYAHDIVAVDKFNYLKQIYLSLVPIYPFYVFTRQGLINEDKLKLWLCILIPLLIVFFFYRQNQFQLAAMDGREEFTNNAGYMFVAIMPTIVFFNKKPFVQYALLALCMFFILLSMKRGAIIIGVLCVLFFLYMSTKSASRSQKGWLLILSVVLLIVGYFNIKYLMNTSDYFNNRIEATLEGNSSQRDVIYSSLWGIYTTKFNSLQLIFGGGACATLRYLGSYAHNDWLELLINQGILGVVAYISYWLYFYKSYNKSKGNPTVSLALFLLLIISFLRTLFSMSYGDMEFFETMTLGYCLANVVVNNGSTKYGSQQT